MARMNMHRCPKCHATETKELEGSDERTCTYCGAQFSLEVAQEAIPRGVADHKPIVIIAVVAILAIAVVAVYLTTNKPVPTSGAQTSAPSSSSFASPQSNTSKIKSVASSMSVSSPDVPAPPEPEPVTATFALHSSLVNSIGGQWFYGMVTNTSKISISKPEVIAILKNDKGEEIATFHAYAAFDLGPGETAPIRIIQKEAMPYQTADFEVLTRALTYGTPAQGLVVSEHKETYGKYGRISMTGRIKNEGETAASSSEVLVLVFDEDDKLINLVRGYAKAKTITPGEEARFLLEYHGGIDPPKIGRLEYKVIGRAAR